MVAGRDRADDPIRGLGREAGQRITGNDQLLGHSLRSCAPRRDLGREHLVEFHHMIIVFVEQRAQSAQLLDGHPCQGTLVAHATATNRPATRWASLKGRPLSTR